jgi:TolB-like protein
LTFYEFIKRKCSGLVIDKQTFKVVIISFHLFKMSLFAARSSSALKKALAFNNGGFTMKEKLFSKILIFVLIWVGLTSPSWAGQVVTESLKLWAKQAIEQEQTLKTISTPNTVAVLYFNNKTGWSKLDPLQKGLTLMLMTDISNVKKFKVVERTRVQALLQELGLGKLGLVESGTAPRVGRLLRAEYLVGGDIFKRKINEFQLKSDLLKVSTKEIAGQCTTEGKLLEELFQMEKDLLFEIIKLLKIELSVEEKELLKKPLSISIEALLNFFKGIYNSDRENYRKAVIFYEKALKEDPGLGIARDALQELQELGLIPKKKKRSLLRSLRNRTSLTDQLTPEEAIKRARTPNDVMKRQSLCDSDNDDDGTPNHLDGCPDDPNKTAPGICGCGVPDTDSDGDGMPECNDGCPDDPNKTAPGMCGCGVPDTDSDGDGNLDCKDGCPNDPNKTAPGICGCGVPDIDSDGDGAPDCKDGCPNDPNKTAPGICGCGVCDDTDSDGDGTPDCKDGCPNDPNKTSSGICGCGVPDIDSDGDGTPDCRDGCPTDPNLTEPDPQCGCNNEFCR